MAAQISLGKDGAGTGRSFLPEGLEECLGRG